MVREPVLPELRAATFAAVCLGLGAAAHLAMSGAAIPTWALVAGGVMAYVPARYVAGRGERGLLGITAVMGSLQVALHLLFSLAQNAAGTTRTSGSIPGTAMPAGMRMPAGMSMPGSAASVPTASAGVNMHMGPGMLVGHAVAALVCAWWLWRGEAAVHALIRSASFRLRELWVPVMFAVPPADRTVFSGWVASRPQTLRSQWLRGALALRGPPSLPALLHL
jgi:hypothetical protein